MKYLTITSLSVLLLFFLVSCEKDEDDDDKNTSSSVGTIQSVSSNVESGDWTITRFEDDGVDELHHFTGYTFTFSTNGSLIATGDTTYTGTWSVTGDNSNDDSPDDNDLDFNINFNLTNEFEDLNDDWDIVSSLTNKIELKDVSGGDGSTDYLTFEKN